MKFKKISVRKDICVHTKKNGFNTRIYKDLIKYLFKKKIVHTLLYCICWYLYQSFDRVTRTCATKILEKHL